MSEPPLLEKELVTRLKAKLGDALKEELVAKRRIKVSTTKEKMIEVARAVSELGFDQVISMGGTDYPQEKIFTVDYHLISVGEERLKPIIFAMTTKIPRDDPKLTTLIDIWPSAEYHEQETFENLGIFFEGHPRMERLLLPEDWADIPPLRREFSLPGR